MEWTNEQLIETARIVSKYESEKAAQLINELANRLEFSCVALCESMEQRKLLKDALSRMVTMHELMMDKVNHAASFYDGNCLSEMNGAPLQAKNALSVSASPYEGAM